MKHCSIRGLTYFGLNPKPLNLGKINLHAKNTEIVLTTLAGLKEQKMCRSNHSDLLKIIADEADLSDDSRSALNSAIEEFKKSGLAS